MTLGKLFYAFGQTPVGVFMRDSTWAFATVEAVHLLGLAVLGGTVTLLALAASNLALKRQTLAVTAQGLLPVFLASLLVMLATGTLLVGSKPYRYFLSDPFRAKMALLALGVILYLGLHAPPSARPYRRTLSLQPQAPFSRSPGWASAWPGG